MTYSHSTNSSIPITRSPSLGDGQASPGRDGGSEGGGMREQPSSRVLVTLYSLEQGQECKRSPLGTEAEYT